ncbi:MAG: mercury(II) reductase, partial [Chloroflexi bacterium]|nr:mercury(II) reductase [Chloroflexota bacterium]
MIPRAYDLAVIGSGSAAFAAAIRATALGARVGMIERGTLGGTCVNIGCVPSKTLLHAGELYHQAGHQPFAGIATSAGGVDLAALVGQKDELVAHLRHEKYEELIAQYGWDLVRGEAHFRDEQTLEVGGRSLRAAHVLVATGASPAAPPIPGLADVDYLTSTSALALTHRPERLVVIGSGYVALELGQLFHHLGSEVTLVQRSPRLLPRFEPEVAAAVQDVLSTPGLRFVAGVRYERVERAADGYRVHVNIAGEPQVLAGDALLVAAGRAPNAAALALERVGVAADARGAVVVDELLRTSNPRVFAAGDVTLGPQFVYVAAYEGALVADNVLNGAQRRIDLRVVPGVTFTNPQVATVGLTEAQARAAG